ncbi:MAG TPA: ABC transporter ATP-binding protein, partial [Acidobacteriota bacterium]|nr:ABC transporter ATP-binding protein [Acidobacteriota bacterium]
LYEDIGVLEYLEFFAALYKIPSLIAKERINKGLKQLDLPVENKLISQLSKGMKRKVLIVRSLLHDPKILIYDEPASGLDPQTSAFILTFMQQLSAQGKTIIFSSHNLSHVQKIAQRVIIVHKGKIASDTTVQQLTKTQEQSFVVTYAQNDTVHKVTYNMQQLKQLLERTDIDILEITTQQISLEDAFFSIVKS